MKKWKINGYLYPYPAWDQITFDLAGHLEKLVGEQTINRWFQYNIVNVRLSNWAWVLLSLAFHI